MSVTFNDVTYRFIELEDAGFVPKDDIQAVTWTRKLPDRTERWLFSYNGPNLQSGFKFRHLSASIAHRVVEELLDAVITRFPLPSNWQVHRNETCWCSFRETAGADYELLDTEVDDIKQLNKASAEVWKILRGGVLPFFETYATLEAINDKADSIPVAQSSGFIGAPPSTRRLIIKKFCNDPGFVAFGDWMVEVSAELGPELQELMRKQVEFVREWKI